MAKIGLKYPVYKDAEGGGQIAKAIQADVSITVNSVSLYADDAIAENDKSFQNGTLTLGIDDLNEGVLTKLLGHAKDSESEEIASNIDDVAPFVGVGFYGVKVVGGSKAYRALWFPKVQFEEPADSMTTKGETVTFGTDSIVGTIMPDGNGDWKLEKTFSSESDAIDYLNTKAGIIVEPEVPEET